MSAPLSDVVVAEFIAAVNRSDTDGIVATFADDAYVNDHRNVFAGRAVIRSWVEKEIVGDHVRIDVLDVVDHHGDTIIRGRYDGTYDKTGLPNELVLTHYFSVRDRRIVSLVIILTQPIAA